MNAKMTESEAKLIAAIETIARRNPVLAQLLKDEADKDQIIRDAIAEDEPED